MTHTFVTDKLEKQLISYRHWFHEYPELATQEFKTTKKIKEILQSWNIRLLPTALPTGVFAEIGTGSGPIVALRADLDGLPLQEATGLTFSSKHPHVMHACGHDTHIAALLGGAFLLKQQESKLPGRVRLIFQPAEEDKEGALQVIADGQINGVSSIIGFHNNPNYSTTEFGIRAGVVSGAIDKFKVLLHGVGTHASAPQNGSDPIVALGAQINALQTISSRNTDPFAAVVLSITHVAAGNTWNILPAESFFEGTVRTADPVVRTQVKKRFFEIVKYTAKAYGVTAEIDWYAGDPSVNNDPHLVSVLAKALNNSATIYPQEKRLGSDDFACYQAKISGVYINIGNNEKISAHNSQFLADDKIVLQGAIFFEKVALSVLTDSQQS